jgi:hypothetical protein
VKRLSRGPAHANCGIFCIRPRTLSLQCRTLPDFMFTFR